MNKKIIVLFITGLFLLTALSVNSIGKTIEKETEGNVPSPHLVNVFVYWKSTLGKKNPIDGASVILTHGNIVYGKGVTNELGLSFISVFLPYPGMLYDLSVSATKDGFKGGSAGYPFFIELEKDDDNEKVKISQSVIEAEKSKTKGKIKCTVYDSRSEIPISNAKLTLKSKDKKKIRIGKTNKNGEHTFNLLPSEHQYEITAAKKYFTKNTVSANLGDNVYISLGSDGSEKITSKTTNGIIDEKPTSTFTHIKLHVIDEEGNDIPQAFVYIMYGNDLAPPSMGDHDLTNFNGNTKWMKYTKSLWGSWIVIRKRGYETKEASLSYEDWDIKTVTLKKDSDENVNDKSRTDSILFNLFLKVHVIDENGTPIPSALVLIMQCNDLAPPTVVNGDLTNMFGYTKWISYIPCWCGNWLKIIKKGYKSKEVFSLPSSDWGEIKVELTKSEDSAKQKSTLYNKLLNIDFFDFKENISQIIEQIINNKIKNGGN